MSFNNVTTQRITVGPNGTGAAQRILLAPIPYVIPGPMPPPPGSVTGTVIDMDTQHPFNGLLAYAHGMGPDDVFIIQTNATSSRDANLIIANNSTTAKSLYVTNNSPGGDTILAGTNSNNLGIADQMNNNGLIFSNGGLTISILGSTGLNGAVLTADGTGKCSWVGGAAARAQIGAASSSEVDKLRAEIRRLSRMLTKK